MFSNILSQNFIVKCFTKSLLIKILGKKENKDGQRSKVNQEWVITKRIESNFKPKTNLKKKMLKKIAVSDYG